MGCVWVIKFTLHNRKFKFEKHTGGDYSEPSDELVREWIGNYLTGDVGKVKVKSR